MAGEQILVVDDEKSIAEAVRYNLVKAGFRVATAADGETAIRRCREEPPDLVLLDLMLPKADGLQVCRTLKQDARTRGVPIIMLTVKGEETDKVVGLELGADDYLTKPFSPRELVARVKVILRRYGEPPSKQEVFTLEGLRVDWARHLVWLKDKTVEMTPKEFDLLRALIDANGRVLTREFLLEMVWGYERSLEIETRTVDLHVSQLRKKLGKVGGRLVTVQHVGYRLAREE